MEPNRFDTLARRVATRVSRRHLSRGLIAGLTTPFLPAMAGDVGAACKRVGQQCSKNKDCCDHAECPGNKCRCRRGFDECAGKCFRLDSDEKHCGSCNNRCADGERCCDGVCVDLGTDPNNCGACGTVCAEGETCFAGDCIVLSGGCTPGSDLCTGVGTAICPDNPACICSKTTEGATICGLPFFDAVCGECATSADCAFRGPDAFCTKTVLPCCGPDAQNVCRVPCPGTYDPL